MEFRLLDAVSRPDLCSEEGGGLIPESMAYYGTYTVNEAEKVVMLHLEASTFPNLIGTDQKRIITSLTADELKYTNPRCDAWSPSLSSMEASRIGARHR